MPPTSITPMFALNTLRKLLGGGLILLLTLAVPVNKLAAQTVADGPFLEPGKPVVRRLAAGEIHDYRVTLAANQYLHAVVLQRGVDVVVKLSGPDGSLLAEVDGLNGIQGPEPVFCIAARAGIYRVEVRPLRKQVAGQYELKIEQLRAAGDTERQRIKAEALFGDADELRREGTAESLKQAVEKFAAALPLFHSLDDPLREVLTLNLIASSHYSLGQTQKAIGSYTQAFKLARATGDRSGEGVALSGLGVVYLRGEPRKGRESLAQALTLFQVLGDDANAAATLVGIGLASLRLGDMQKARESYSRALPLARSVGERESEAKSLGGLGYVYLSSGEKGPATDSFNEALAVARAAGDRLTEADALSGLAILNNNAGEPQKARDQLLQALPLFLAIGDSAGAAAAYNNLGVAYAALSDKEKVLDAFRRGLDLARTAEDRTNEAKALIGIGMVNISVGETQKALDDLTRALTVARAAGNQALEGEALASLGFTYGRTGDTKKAIDSFNEAFPLLRKAGNRSGEALALALLGFVYINSGDLQKAQDAFSQALSIAQAIGDRNVEAQALNGLGTLSLADPQKAQDYSSKSLLLSRGNNSPGMQADSLIIKGFAHFLDDEPEEALDSFTEAMRLYRDFGDRQGELAALANLALVERSEGNLQGARAHIEGALKIMESLRTKIINQERRASFFASGQEYYNFYVDLLMRQHELRPSAGYDGEALHASELARARALLDILAEANAEIHEGVDPQLLRRERSLQQRLNDRAQAQMRLSRGQHTEEQADALAKEIEELTAAYEQVRTEIRQTSSRYAALTQPRPLTAKEIQSQILDEDTLLLEYSLNSPNSFIWNYWSETSYVWAVTSDSVKSYRIAGRREIETAARRLYDLLNARNKRVDGETRAQREARVSLADSQIQDVGRSLSRLVLAPVAAQLSKKRLIIVADGLLHYIPFAMLPDPNAPAESAAPRPLIAEHEIVSLPSASALAVIRQEVRGRAPAPKTVVALADPVFTKDDERVKGVTRGRNRGARRAPPHAKAEMPRDLELIDAAENTGFAGGELRIPRLRGSRREAQEIAAMVPAAQRKLVLDFEANRQTATSAELSQYRYIHFSTHGFLNNVHPELSGVVLSLVNRRGEPQDGFLRAHEVFNLRLPAEVVVLSACQTGIGKEVRGEGLISLTRGFMYAGSPRVVVSLWSVSEAATAELMVRFYRHMMKDGLRPAAALRAAQLSLMKEKKWQSPFYWAAFTLQGEWQ